MPQRMTAQRVAAEQDDVHHENDGAETNTEILAAGGAVEEEHRVVRIFGEDDQKNERRVQEVAVNVLNHQRQEALAAIALARFTDGAVRGIGPEALVVRTPIVVARESEPGGEWQNQQGRREREKTGNPPRSRSMNPGVRR